MKYNQPYGGAVDAPYVNGDPSIGRAGSIPPAESIEYPQREIVNLINDVALATAANTDLHQLAKAIQSQKLISKDDAGTANAYAVTLSPAPTAYFKYMTVVMQVTNANTGASVINVNALGSKNITHTDLSSLTAGELRPGSIVCLVYDGTQFQMVWSSIVGGAPVFLTASRVFYVNGATGSDSNDGTAATTGSGHGPFLTLQKAMNVIVNYNLNGFDITVNVADSTYTGGLQLKQMAGSGNVNWIGNSATPANVHVSTTNKTPLQGTDVGKSHNLTGFKFSATNGGSPIDEMAGIILQGGSTVVLTNCEFGTCVDAHMKILLGARIRYSGNLRVSGNASSLITVSQGGLFDSLATSPPNIVMTFVVPVTYSIANIYATTLGVSQLLILSGSGTVTGKRYQADLNAVINSGGGGVGYYAGTIAGTTSGGGQYA